MEAFCTDTSCCDPKERSTYLRYLAGDLPLDRDTLRWCGHCDLCLRNLRSSKHSIHCAKERR